MVHHRAPHIARHPHRKPQQIAQRIDRRRPTRLLVLNRSEHHRRHRPAIHARPQQPHHSHRRMPRQNPPHHPNQPERHRIRQPRPQVSRRPRPPCALHPSQLVAERRPQALWQNHQPHHIVRHPHAEPRLRQPLSQHEVLGVVLPQVLVSSSLLERVPPQHHAYSQREPRPTLDHVGHQNPARHLHALAHRVQLRRQPAGRPSHIQARRQLALRIGQLLHHPPQIVRRHPRVRIARHQRLVLCRLRQHRHRPHLRIGKLRLAAGQEPRPHPRMFRRNPLRHLQPRVVRMARAEQQLILRII